MMNKVLAIFFLLAFLLHPDTAMAIEDEYIKNIEITEADINVDHFKLPYVAYLAMTITNNGDRKISNMAVEIKYFKYGDLLMHKSVIRDVLKEPISPGGTKKYNIRLNGDFANTKNEQYPYSSPDKVTDFDIKIITVKYR